MQRPFRKPCTRATGEIREMPQVEKSDVHTTHARGHDMREAVRFAQSVRCAGGRVQVWPNVLTPNDHTTHTLTPSPPLHTPDSAFSPLALLVQRWSAPPTGGPFNTVGKPRTSFSIHRDNPHSLVRGRGPGGSWWQCRMLGAPRVCEIEWEGGMPPFVERSRVHGRLDGRLDCLLVLGVRRTSTCLTPCSILLRNRDSAHKSWAKNSRPKCLKDLWARAKSDARQRGS